MSHLKSKIEVSIADIDHDILCVAVASGGLLIIALFQTSINKDDNDCGSVLMVVYNYNSLAMWTTAEVVPSWH